MKLCSTCTINKYFVFLMILIQNLFYFGCLKSEEKPLFAVLAPPKCGTFLIGKTLELITQKPAYYFLGDLDNTPFYRQLIHDAKTNGVFIVAHHYHQSLINDLTRHGYKIVFLLRDPRDQLISALNWIREGQWPGLKVSLLNDYNSQIEELITGQLYGEQAFEMFMKRQIKVVTNLSPHKLFVTKFENLVGVKGGGDKERQTAELMNLAQFLGYSLTQEEAENIGNQVFTWTPTFRKGQIGQWKETFLPHHQSIYKLKYGKMLISLDYEKDLNW